MWTRRRFLAAAGLGALAAACGGAGTSGAGSPSGGSVGSAGSIDALTKGRQTLSLIGTGSDAPPMNPGPNRLGLVLVTAANQALESGRPEVWVAKSPSARAVGPATASWYPLDSYDKTGDHSPKSPIPGIYVADVTFPTAGPWNVGVAVDLGSGHYGGQGAVLVSAGDVPGAIGSKAISVRTPVATTDHKIAEICTRDPVCHLHTISLDTALTNGKPTVVAFATPKFCQSQLCGPVLDEHIVAAVAVGAGKANFIHVEEFLPGPGRQPPAPTQENQSPGFKAWKLDTEPWTFVIDGDGAVRFRALGPCAAPEIEAAVQRLT